jgi:hypothetical protein
VSEVSVRQHAVQFAKKRGLCTQCLKNPHAKERLQCTRCINTNKRKRERRKHKYDEYQARNHDANLKNPYRKIIIQHAIEENICTKCFGRPTTTTRQCDICLERKLRWARTKRLKKKEKRGRKRLYTDEQRKEKQREYNRKYRKKQKVKKIINLDRIKHAVAKGGEL